MKIYFIHGDEDSGKTFVCNKLRKKFLEGNSAEISYDNLKWPNDFRSILKVKDQKVAIYSAGDSSSILRDSLNFGIKNKCDILIAPIRTNIKYNKPIRECLTKGKDDCEWLTLSSSDTDEDRIINEDNFVLKLLELI